MADRLEHNPPVSLEHVTLERLAPLAHCSCRTTNQPDGIGGREQPGAEKDSGQAKPQGHGATPSPHGIRPVRLLAVRPGEHTWHARGPKGERVVLRRIDFPDALGAPVNAPPELPDASRVRWLRRVCPQCPYLLVRGWVEGVSFAHLAVQPRRPSPRAVIRWVQDVGRTLERLLSCGAAPAYLSPQNLFLDRFGRVVLTEPALWRPAALARFRSAGSRPLLYLAWVAPEVLHGGELTEQSALSYSLAACAASLLGVPAPPLAVLPPERHEVAWWQFARRLEAVGLARRWREQLLVGCAPNPEERSGGPAQWAEGLAAINRSRRYAVVPVQHRSEPPLLGPQLRPPTVRWQPWLRSVLAGLALGATVTAAFVTTRFTLPSGLPVPLRIVPSERPALHAASPLSRARRWRVASQEAFREALVRANEGDVVLLENSGPFTVPEQTIEASITILGTASAEPVVLVGEHGLHVRARSLAVENVHFVVPALPGGASQPDPVVLAEVDELELVGCSIQALHRGGKARCGIAVLPLSPQSMPRVVLDRVLLKGLDRQIELHVNRAAELQLANVLATGSGRCIVLVANGAPDARFSCWLSRTSIYGPTVLTASAAPPRSLPWIDVRAERCLFVPRNRSRAVVELHYGRKPAVPVERFSWQGDRTLLPHAAQVLRAVYHSGGEFVLNSVLEWQRFWGEQDTGLVGIPLPFVDALPPGTGIAPPSKRASDVGVNATLLRFPDLQTVARLLEHSRRRAPGN